MFFTLIGVVITGIFTLLYQEREWKKREKEARREFLVKIIYDEAMPKTTRAEAGKEYIEARYNSTTKYYILQKGLLDNLPKRN